MIVGFYSFIPAISLGDGYLKTFFEKTKNMSPEERAQFLEADDVRINLLVSILFNVHHL